MKKRQSTQRPIWEKTVDRDEIDIKKGVKKFYVRYDLITDFVHEHGKKLL